MQDSFALAGLVIFSFLASIPCGYIRESFKKFSIPWLFLAHLPIPLVVHLRLQAGFGWKVVPFTLLSAVAGQIVGGWYRRRRLNVKETSQRAP